MYRYERTDAQLLIQSYSHRASIVVLSNTRSIDKEQPIQTYRQEATYIQPLTQRYCSGGIDTGTRKMIWGYRYRDTNRELLIQGY